MTADAKKELEKQLQTLSRDGGLGIFPNLERQVTKGEKFLIISYGGTGADVLNSLKESIYRDLADEDIENSIRILSIDTDKNTKYRHVTVRGNDGQYKSETVERFTPKEFFWLDNNPAKQAVNIGDPGMTPWINPKLPDIIKADGKFLDGNGASSTRQIGRLLLFPQKTVTSLESKITDLAKELTDGTTSNLNIFIISGISGGTGSGTVIDTTYLIRYFIGKLPGNLADKTNFCGFILLPPTGVSDNPVDIEKGNRNGYAALKEIDHFMTIAHRGELYRQQFGNTNVEITKNIFDTCYLIDGNIVGMAFSNPREKAKEVVTDCILDMITSLPLTDETGTPVPPVQSFMSDAMAFSLAMVSGQREQVAPREANYVYCAIGHGKALVPIELLKSYVAGSAFGEMYKLYKNCSGVTYEDIDDFLEALLIKDYDELAQKARVIEETDGMLRDVSRSMKKGGPFYAVNMIKEAAAEANNRYLDLSAKKLVRGKEKKLAQLQYIKKLLSDRLDDVFSVYAEIIEQLSSLFKAEHDILCESDKFRAYAGTTYTFTPIDFTAQDTEAAKIRAYLSELVTPKLVDDLSRRFTDSLVSRRTEWTELLTPKGSGRNPAFNGARLIRDFWEENVDKIVNVNIEDFLIKYYSGDKEAVYKTEKTPEGFVVETEETSRWLKKAAVEIVDKMLGSAGIANPLAEIREYILNKENFNGRNIFLVPEKASHLKKYIEEEIQTRIGDKNKILIASSSANDRISCYAQYTGIPAYMFSWAKTGEEDYEKGVRADSKGLHMSETKGGELWREYPNLIVESIWPKISNPQYYNEREHQIGEKAKTVFGKAKELGLAELHALSSINNFGEYTLYSLPEKYRPDTALFKNFDTEFEGTTAKEKAKNELDAAIEEKAEMLYSLADWDRMPELAKADLPDALRKTDSPVAFRPKVMSFPGTVPTAYTDNLTEKPAGWEEELASRLLRTCPDFYNDMRGTVLVMDSLYRKVNNKQQTKNRLKNFAFCLAADIFAYNDDLYQWTYDDAGEAAVLAEIEYGNKEMKAAEYYFMFQEYLKNAVEINEAVAEEVAEKRSGKDQAEKISKAKAIKENAMALAEEIGKRLTPDRNNPNQEEILSSRAFRESAKYRAYDVEAIIAFYKDLKVALEFI